MAKSLFAKNALKIENSYRMFAELWEAFAGGRALDREAKNFKRFRPRSPYIASPRGSISVQFLFEASDLATEEPPRRSGKKQHL